MPSDVRCPCCGAKMNVKKQLLLDGRVLIYAECECGYKMKRTEKI